VAHAALAGNQSVSSQEINDQSRGVSPPTLKQPGKPDIIAPDGQRYVWRRTHPLSSLPSEQSQPAPPEDPTVVTEEELKAANERFSHMTAAELAKGLRDVMLIGQDEYLLDHDPIDVAERVLANDIQQTEGHIPDGVPISPDAVPHVEPETAPPAP
jgi:hypothetical protein